MIEPCITQLKVAEAMSNDFGLINENTPIHVATDLILNNHWGEVVIIDDNNNFIGLVSKEHLVKVISNGVHQDMRIKDICSENTIISSGNQDLVSARDIMRKHKIGRLPVINNVGDIVGMLTARDICNGFSSKLEALGQYMYLIMNNIEEAIQVINNQNIITFWNYAAEKLFDKKTSEVIGQKLEDTLKDELLLQVLRERKPQRNILCELRDQVYVVRNAIPIISPTGIFEGVVCTNVDVSHSKSLIEQYDEANHRIKKLERLIDDNNELFYTIDPNIERILRKATKVARTDATVLLQGESGTGKGMLANVIYKNSKRSQKPFISINCSAIPETLFESEMFGYESGTFTGGNKNGKQGKFELAKGGTIFLDEIGELPLDLQAKLLRVLQDGKFYRVGGTESLECDVRVIAATNRNLLKLVEDKKFREDLYYRLNVVNLDLPPLREHKIDIPELINKFTKQLSKEYDHPITGIDEEVKHLLISYDWPGNVRQLHNMLEKVVILMEGNCIMVKTLHEADIYNLLINEASTSDVDGPPIYSEECVNLDEMILDHEKDVITQALQRCHYNKTKTAELLGIPRSTLYYKLKSLDIYAN